MTTEDFVLPTVGPTGSAVISCQHRIRRENQRHDWLPPVPPSRDVPMYDDDGEIAGWVTRTSEEFAIATLAYEGRLAEWQRTGGVHFSAGLTTHTIAVVCADGCTAKGVGDGQLWRWTEWTVTTPPPTQPAK